MPQPHATQWMPISLPGGGDAAVRPLRGADEEWVASLATAVPEPVFVTELLARAARLSDGTRGADAMRRLTPGDRDFLLLQIGRATFGSRVELVLTCPAADCGALMDSSFDLESVPVESRPVRESYTLRLPDGSEITYRLPRGADQEDAVGWNAHSPAGKRSRFLAQCVVSGSPPASPEEMALLARAIDAHAPKADLEFDAVCPECARSFTERLDAAQWLIVELRRRLPDFEREIHLLSLHYHWPLRKVLAMTRERRVRWAGLLLREIERPVAAAAGLL